MIKGKSYKAVAKDVAEGFVSVNPILLKPLDNETLKLLYNELLKAQADVRAEKFPYLDTDAIRQRNARLQRLHSSTMILRNFARERRIPLI